MIKIPESKYQKCVEEHYRNVKNSLEEIIKIYINICKVIDGTINYKILSPQIISINQNSIKSIFSKVSDSTKNKSIENIVNNADFKDEFKKNYFQIEVLLSDFIDVSSEVYIEKIIKSKPLELIELYNSARTKYPIIDSTIMKDILSKIFNYEKFVSRGFDNGWNAYSLTEKLDINVCPYCNRIYTFSVKKLRKNNSSVNLTRPELDHYLPKSKFPMFALSFFNLIPSCHICNSSLKGDKDLDMTNNLHPYISGVEDIKIFEYEVKDISVFKGDKSSVEVKIADDIRDQKIINSLNFFKIAEIYKNHNDEVASLLYKSSIYNDSMLSEIVKFFNSKSEASNSITKEELFKTIFNEPVSKEEILNRSLGKLDYDIIQQIKENYKL